MATQETPAPRKRDLPTMTMAAFLETHPPGDFVRVTDIETRTGNLDVTHSISVPDIQIHCSSRHCGGPRFFRCTDRSKIEVEERGGEWFLRYVCSNCRQDDKLFAIGIGLDSTTESATAICLKLGEYPAFGPPTPARLIRLIESDRELFLKGRQSENRGLGIGAFVYYRRVVENQKDRIFGEIKKVLEKIGGKPNLIALLDDAIAEMQFKKALAIAAGAIPETLLIGGQNPLSLLHSALSRGIHNLSDSECLELATDIRVVLIELSERIGESLRDEAELKKAVSRLMNKTIGD